MVSCSMNEKTDVSSKLCTGCSLGEGIFTQKILISVLNISQESHVSLPNGFHTEEQTDILNYRAAMLLKRGRVGKNFFYSHHNFFLSTLFL